MFGNGSSFAMTADLGVGTVGARDGCLVLNTPHGTVVPEFSVPVEIVEDGHAVVVGSGGGGVTIRIGDRVRLGGGWVGEESAPRASPGCRPGPMVVGNVEHRAGTPRSRIDVD